MSDTPRHVPAWLKIGLDFGPILLFFLAYGRMKDRVFEIGGTEYQGFIVVTALFVPLLLLCTGILWWLTGKLSKMQVVTAVLVVVFGSLSVWFNDERFFKMKPTIIYVIFGAALAIGLARGKSYLEGLMGEAMPLKREGWLLLTKRIMWFFFGLAVANELVWRLFSTEVWVSFKTFGLTAALFLFFMTQGKLLEEYGVEEEKGSA
ncbi:inner membrane-spanning protein YciB [Pseudoroseicyclus tamaricis]|uniref:Inner membrane-spanning protein YciB n=1 Tax=Pseudoroseicyclus tamaricis TaxID=2705421 RepID=A0A6B2JTR3_9RHOB|nr:inner membrane-spanning protein YciB [Pseudoroseicyclus tamaricis]NDV01947.1 septation protein IspZ [Pseudoroseicyclus tamaricis]